MRALLVLLCGAVASAQTLGQFRIVDFSRRTPSVVYSATNVAGVVEITTQQAHGRSTGDAIYIYTPYTLDQDLTITTQGNGGVNGQVVWGSRGGNRGKGYFIITVTDATHFSIDKEMYTDSTTIPTVRGIAAGDKIVPLTTYYLRQGPRGWFDGPVPTGAWSSSITYRALQSVTYGGNTYMAIAPGANHQPPNSTYWKQVDPAKIGPGTFTASLMDSSATGKANSNNYAWTQLQGFLASTWPAAKDGFDCSHWASPYNGAGTVINIYNWLGTGSTASYNRIIANLGHAYDWATCSPLIQSAIPWVSTTGSYGGRNEDQDYGKAASAHIYGVLSAVYETLTTGQKATLRDQILNDNLPMHNGGDDVQCVMDQWQQGSGTITRTVGTNRDTITGSGFSSLAGLGRESVIMAMNAGKLSFLGKVESFTDTTMTVYKRAGEYVWTSIVPNGTTIAWGYAKPWGHDGVRSCGTIGWLKRAGDAPRMIPGLEKGYQSVSLGGSDDYGGKQSYDTPRTNRTIDTFGPFLAMAMVFAEDDIRAVRLGEQILNYYMTQSMAQEWKSRWGPMPSGGTSYGPGRMTVSAMQAALVIKNSLTVTPPGVLTGNYLKSVLSTEMYNFWVGKPTWQMPWGTGAYNVVSNANSVDGNLRLVGGPLFVGLHVFPDDPMAPAVWDYFRNRRGDYGTALGAEGWQSLIGTFWTYPFYEPAATSASITTKPLAYHTQSDTAECIAAGLYCIADSIYDYVWSLTGWGSTATQVLFHGSNLHIGLEDSQAMAGTISILQNNGANSAYLLGGSGVGDGTISDGTNPLGAGWEGNTLGIRPAGATIDLATTPVPNNIAHARMDRYAAPADDTYVFARTNLAPKIRSAATNYDPAQAQTISWWKPAATATRGQRSMIHFKSGSSAPNYVVVYDDVATGSPMEMRAYWHYQVTPPWVKVRDISKVAFDANNKTVVFTQPSTGRLSSKILPVAGANTVALTHDYPPDPQTVSVSAASWSGGVATLTTAALYQSHVIPVGSSVVVAGISPTGWNGTFTVTASTATSISYELSSAPGARVSGGTVATGIRWCEYATPGNPQGSCEGLYGYNQTYSLNKYPGTYRADVCASTDGTTCAAVTSGEWITVHKSSTSISGAMPAMTQPECTATGGSCTALEILDSSYPKVAVFARQGSMLSEVSLTTTHAGTARYVAAGLSPGLYEVTVNGIPASADVTVHAGDGTLSFSAGRGEVRITRKVAALLVVSPDTLEYRCTSGGEGGPQNVAVTAEETTLDQWRAVTAPSWISVSPDRGMEQGSFQAAVQCRGMAAGSYSGTISVSTATEGISNSPQSVDVAMTVYPPVTITSMALPVAVAGMGYAKTLVAAGGQPPYTWTVVSGALCAGMTLSSAGVLSGTPAGAETCHFTIGVRDAGGGASSHPWNLIVYATPPPLPAVSGAAAIGGNVQIK